MGPTAAERKWQLIAHAIFFRRMSTPRVIMSSQVVDSGSEVKGQAEGGTNRAPSGQDYRNFPCRRPAHANPRVFEFERYLDLAGVTKALNGALGSLCAQKPKPDDPLRFIVEKMREAGDVGKWSEGVISLRSELSQLKTLVMYAQTENDRYRAFLLRSGMLEEEESEIPGEDFEEEFEDEEEEQNEEVEEAIVPVPSIAKNVEKAVRKTKKKKKN